MRYLNTSQNDIMSATNAVGFSHHDPAMRQNNVANGFPLASPLNGGQITRTSQNDWLGATRANGFAPNYGVVKGAGKEDVYSDLKTGLKKAGKFLHEHNEKLKKSKIISRTARHALGGNPVGNTIADLAEMMGYGNVENETQFQPRGSNITGLGSRINWPNETLFKPAGEKIVDFKPVLAGGKSMASGAGIPSKFFTGNYYTFPIPQKASLFGGTTVGLVPDLGIAVQPLRQQFNYI